VSAQLLEVVSQVEVQVLVAVLVELEVVIAYNKSDKLDECLRYP
jgi:hypothetical protein